MKQVIEIPVDFSNSDDDGAVRLITQGTLDYLKSHDVNVVEGLSIRMTDGELAAEGLCTQRDGMWVAVIKRWIV